MSYSEFFHQCLTHPQHGFYMNHNMFSKEGDFITSPEISQLFSEQIGIWHVMLWEHRKTLNSPRLYVELGPGSGKLSLVVFDVFRQFGVLKNMEFHLVEVSPFLTQIQQEKFN